MCPTEEEEREDETDDREESLKDKATWKKLSLNFVIDTALLVTVSEADLSRTLFANFGFSKEPLVLR